MADHVGERLDALEKGQAEIYHDLREKKEAGLGGKIAEHLTLSGLVEIEAAYERLSMDQGGDESGSDLTLATVEVGLGATVNDEVSAAIANSKKNRSEKIYPPAIC